MDKSNRPLPNDYVIPRSVKSITITSFVINVTVILSYIIILLNQRFISEKIFQMQFSYERIHIPIIALSDLLVLSIITISLFFLTIKRGNGFNWNKHNARMFLVISSILFGTRILFSKFLNVLTMYFLTEHNVNYIAYRAIISTTLGYVEPLSIIVIILDLIALSLISYSVCTFNKKPN